MLNEEAFFLVVLLFACGLLGLGTLEMIWPTQPRHPVRKYRADPWRRARPRGLGMPVRLAAVGGPAISVPLPIVEATPFLTQLETAAEQEAVELATVAELEATVTELEATVTELEAAAEPETELERTTAVETPEPTVEPDAVVAMDAQPPSPALPPVAGVIPLVVQSSEKTSPIAAGDRPVDERCFALLEDERFAEVVRLAQAHLQVRKAAGPLVPSTDAARETTRLWGAVGLAKQGLDDHEGARFAFEEAIAVAPQTERPTWERNLAALALTTARRSLEAGATDPVGPERIESIRSAIEWLGRGLAVAPDNQPLRDTHGAARDALWLASEAMVKLLIKQKRLAEAREHLDDVLMDPECPPARQRAFRGLWGRAMGSDVAGAVTAAVRHLDKGREDDAIAALARAESSLAQIPAAALPPKRRGELMQRLWSAYMKLGADRLESGAHEDAMSPLFRALALDDIGPERQAETRAALVRVLEDVAAARSVQIGAIIEAGDASAAGIQGDKLWSLLRSAVDQGLPQDDLTAVFEKVSALFQRAGRAP